MFKVLRLWDCRVVGTVGNLAFDYFLLGCKILRCWGLGCYRVLVFWDVISVFEL